MAEPQPVEPTAGDVPKDDAAGSQPAEGHVTTQPVTPHGKSVPGSPANTTRPVAAPGLGGDSLAAPPPPSTQPPAAAQPGRSLQASIFGASTTSASHMMLASVSQQSSIWVEKQNRGRRLRQRPEGPIKPHAPRKPRSRFHPERLGPASYQPNASTTSMGKQPVSTHRTAPAFGFGSGSRGSKKVYYSAAHARCQPSLETQEATTCNVVSAVGKQPDSRRKTAPSSSFGSAPRFGRRIYFSRAHVVDQLGHDAPAAHYSIPSQFKRKPKRKGRRGRKKPPQPGVSFGFGARRLSYLKAGGAQVPGPGKYKMDRKSAQAARAKKKEFSSFGVSTREGARKASLMRGGETAFLGEHSPGPGTYFPTVTSKGAAQSRAPSHAFGDLTQPTKPRPQKHPAPWKYTTSPAVGRKQVVSTRATAPVPSFGKASKEAKFHHESAYVPGAGAYDPMDSTLLPGFTPVAPLSEVANSGGGGFTFGLAQRA